MLKIYDDSSTKKFQQTYNIKFVIMSVTCLLSWIFRLIYLNTLSSWNIRNQPALRQFLKIIAIGNCKYGSAKSLSLSPVWPASNIFGWSIASDWIFFSVSKPSNGAESSPDGLWIRTTFWGFAFFHFSFVEWKIKIY